MNLANKYYLVYDGNTFIMAGFATGELSSNKTIETFDNVQSMVDRGLALGLISDTDYRIQALEHGATLPQGLMDELLSDVWSSGSYYFIKRMTDLGYSQP
jgi:hypothetical protein